jgi:hypothetical protein
MNEQIKQILEEVIQKKLQEQQDKEVETRIKILTASYDKAISYTNLIIFAGYAGVFTLWNFTREFLHEKVIILSAALIGVSLFVFCAWEVWKMIASSKMLHRQSEVLMKNISPEMFQVEIRRAEFENQKELLGLNRLWPSVLWVTIVLAFGGALLILCDFVFVFFDIRITSEVLSFFCICRV